MVQCFACGYPVFQCLFLKIIQFFYWNAFAPLSETIWTYLYGSLLEISIRFCQYIFICLQIPHYLGYYNSKVSLKTCQCDFFNFFCLYKNVLTIKVPFFLKSICLYNKSPWDFYCNGNKSIDQFVENWNLYNIETSHPWTWMFLKLYRYCLISFISILSFPT